MSVDRWNEALEAPLIERPDDLDAHAVYADWLQEQGDARGELMAASIAVARMRDNDPVRVATLRRSLEQAEALKPALLGESLAARLEVVWRLGLVREARISGPDAGAILAELAQRPVARLLDLLQADGVGSTSVLPAIAAGATPVLRALHVRDERTADYGGVWTAAPRLAFVSSNAPSVLGDLRVPRLRELSVGRAGEAVIESIVNATVPLLDRLWLAFRDELTSIVPLTAAPLPALRSLTIFHRAPPGPFVRALAASPLAAGLVQLRLFTPLDDDAAEALVAARPRLARVTHLDIQGALARDTRRRFFGR